MMYGQMVISPGFHAGNLPQGSFPRFSVYGNFHTGILVGIFTVELADGRMDVTDNEHTVRQMVVFVTSQVGWQTDESCI